MNDLVSIIVPVYNVENYIEKCLESCVNQTYKNIEIIVVNDGSTDGSLEIINKYAKNDGRIIVINKINGGLSSARNAALEILSGEYITFLDGDDYIEIDFIKTLLDLLIESKADMVCCEKIGSDNDKNTTKIFNADEAIDVYLKYNKYVREGVCVKIYKKELFDNEKFEMHKIHEDTFMTYKILQKTNYIAYTGYQGYHAVVRDGSITQKKYSEKNYDKVLGCKKIYENFKGTKFEELAINKYLGAAIYFAIKTNGNKEIKNNKLVYEDISYILKNKKNNKVKLKFLPFIVLYKMKLLNFIKIS